MRHETSDYRGRFAPTPSGPLHEGSLLTALASYLQAKARGGSWLLRIDDLDTPRIVPEAEAMIQRQLEAHGLVWDSTVRRQSEHLSEYEAALAALERRGLLYPCHCSRAALIRDSLPGPDGPIYAGTCRHQTLPTSHRHATRIKTSTERLCFSDALQGQLERQLDLEVGDFILRRSDGQIAYQLACTVDEAAQEITEAVRGADLIGSTFRQLSLMKLLHIAPPAYRHLPLLIDANGNKLSKQNHAQALDSDRAAENIYRALMRLNQLPPAELKGAPVMELIQWGIAHWNANAVPTGNALVASLR